MNFLAQVSTNWFLIYYITLGSLLLGSALYWLRRPQPLYNYIMKHVEADQKPAFILLLLRYLAILSLLSLLLSFFPFSGIELAFSLWSLIILYLLASILVKWQHLRKLLAAHPQQLYSYIRKA
ncbi:MAG: hypothetical protein ACOC2C_08835, partial [Cyclonatronaceae bacterium]